MREVSFLRVFTNSFQFPIDEKILFFVGILVIVLVMVFTYSITESPNECDEVTLNVSRTVPMNFQDYYGK